MLSKPRYTILVVDDSPVIRSSFREFLLDIDRAEFDVLEADNGVAALMALGARTTEVDLIVTDLEMPQMDGLSFIRHLRQQEKYQGVPILFLTSHGDPQKRIEVFRFGATDYVLKPFLAPELESRIMGYLERKRAFETILEHERELKESIEQARVTQASLMPAELPVITGASLAVKYVPAEDLAGDYYDFYDLGEGKVGILVADVAGHGISAALVSFLIAGILKHNAAGYPQPDALLQRTNEMLHGKIPEARYATAFYAAFDPKDASLTYASAGHPPAVLIRPSNGEVTRLFVEGTPLGMTPPDKTEYQPGSVALEAGDKVLFQSDAILEIENDRRQALGFKRLQRFLVERTELAPEALLDAVYEHGLAFGQRTRYPDDVTMIMLEVAGP